MREADIWSAPPVAKSIRPNSRVESCSALPPHQAAHSQSDPDEISELLAAMRAGERSAMDRLVPVVYGELRQMARRQLSRERPDHTLDTGALVNEAYLKLAGLRHIDWQDRAHFLAAAAGAMRRILIDYAVSRRALKRGGREVHVTLSGDEHMLQDDPDDILALGDALDRLRELDDRQATVVEYRFFAGMSIDEVASVLQVSPMTVKRDWTAARAWLNRELTA